MCLGPLLFISSEDRSQTPVVDGEAEAATVGVPATSRCAGFRASWPRRPRADTWRPESVPTLRQSETRSPTSTRRSGTIRATKMSSPRALLTFDALTVPERKAGAYCHTDVKPRRGGQVPRQPRRIWGDIATGAFYARCDKMCGPACNQSARTNTPLLRVFIPNHEHPCQESIPCRMRFTASG